MRPPDSSPVWGEAWARAFRVALAVLKHDHPAAEDVAQGTAEKLFENWASIRSPEVKAVRLSWVATTARRIALDRIGDRQEPTDRVPGEQVDSHEHAVALQITVDLAVASLPPHLAETIRLRYAEDLSIREISRVLRLREGTVANRLTLALKLLREYFGVEPT